MRILEVRKIGVPGVVDEDEHDIRGRLASRRCGGAFAAEPPKGKQQVCACQKKQGERKQDAESAGHGNFDGVLNRTGEESGV
jgi:hypothetical protein